jgi:hypothetical protein
MSQKKWGFELCPSSSILKNREHNGLETGCFSFLGERVGLNSVGVSLSRNSFFVCFVCFTLSSGPFRMYLLISDQLFLYLW